MKIVLWLVVMLAGCAGPGQFQPFYEYQDRPCDQSK